MREGFLASRSLDFTRPDDWVAGEPEPSLWFGTRVRGRAHGQVTALRCERCGYIELYARSSPQVDAS